MEKEHPDIKGQVTQEYRQTNQHDQAQEKEVMDKEIRWECKYYPLEILTKPEADYLEYRTGVKWDVGDKYTIRKCLVEQREDV